MRFQESKQELPWAVEKKPGYKGEASGLYFHFAASEREAQRIRRALIKEGKHAGEVTYMPGQAWRLGSFVL